jgi:plasmid stabilization system protein ParE
MLRVTRRPLADTDILEIWDFIADGTVFYVPLDGGIDVVRVLNGARDIDAVFSPEP